MTFWLRVQKTFRFPTAKQTQPIESIEWAPPLKNWNCWQGCHINSRTNAYKTLERISEELMAKEMQKQHSPALIRSRQDLPSFMYRHQVIETVEKNSVVVIKGTTGCGKSTQASKRSCLFFNCKKTLKFKHFENYTLLITSRLHFVNESRKMWFLSSEWHSSPHPSFLIP